MRKIVAGQFITLDGVVEYDDRWTRPYHGPELGQAIGGLISAGDTLLLGRITYELFAATFGSQAGGEAEMMNNLPKVVVSSTLKSADWQNSTLINENAAEKIVELKKTPGKVINVTGSGTLIRWLLRDGLLDELNLFVFPVAVGKGKRLFQELDGEVSLKLTGSTALPKGVLHLCYSSG
jgi:dihydrofolate reductase